MPKRKGKPVKKETWVQGRLLALLGVLALSFATLVFAISFSRTNPIAEEDYNACGRCNFAYSFDPKDKIAYFEGKNLSAPTQIPVFLTSAKDKAVLGVTSSDERWVEVDISDQKLIAHEGDSVFLESAVSTGLPGYDTPYGEYRVWYKTKSQKMSGGQGKSYYYLPNVPYIMFFENSEVPGYRGFSLHGTYWHNDFGIRKSHGCVNLPTPVAEQLYYWTSPTLSEGNKIARATDDNPGTRIIIHE